MVFLNLSMHFKIQCALNLRIKMRCGIDVKRAHACLSRQLVPLEMMVTLTTSNPATFVDSFLSLDPTQALVEQGIKLGQLKQSGQGAILWKGGHRTSLWQPRTQCYIFIKFCMPQPIPLTVHLVLEYDLQSSAVPWVPRTWPLASLTAIRNKAACISQVSVCISHFTSAYKISFKSNPGVSTSSWDFYKVENSKHSTFLELKKKKNMIWFPKPFELLEVFEEIKVS